MCFNLADFDPFEPLYVWDYGDGSYIDSEPMNEYDWEEWLSNDFSMLVGGFALILIANLYITALLLAL